MDDGGNEAQQRQTMNRNAHSAILNAIDPRCDAILEVQGQEGNFDLYVSTRALSLASSVFDKMFSSRYMEGHEQNKGVRHIRVPLPEDDGDALLAICKVIHHRAGDLGSMFSASEILNIAYVSEKYDFTETLRHWSSTWLKGSLEQSPQEDLNSLLGAACMLDSWEAFSHVSLDVILNQTGPFIQHPLPEGMGLPGSTKVYLEARRTEISFKVIDTVEKAVAALLSTSASTTYGRHPAEAWVRQLGEAKLWPIGRMVRENSLSSLCDRMKSFREPWYALESGNALLYKEADLNMRVRLSELRQEILEDRTGICLDCIHTRGESALRRECRLENHGQESKDGGH